MLRKFVTMILVFSMLFTALESFIMLVVNNSKQTSETSSDLNKQVEDLEDDFDEKSEKSEKNEKLERTEYFTELYSMKFSADFNKSKLYSFWKQTVYAKYFKDIITPPPQYIC